MGDWRNLGYPASEWDRCHHEWKETADEDNNEHVVNVICTKCGCPGQRDNEGDTYWPTT